MVANTVLALVSCKSGCIGCVEVVSFGGYTSYCAAEEVIDLVDCVLCLCLSLCRWVCVVRVLLGYIGGLVAEVFLHVGIVNGVRRVLFFLSVG